MKAVTIHLDEPVYRDFQKIARRTKRSTSDLIREAMEYYKQQLVKTRKPLWQGASAVSVGQVLKPWKGREDLLGDFLERE